VADTPGAAEAARQAAVAVDRHGFVVPHALCLRALAPGRALTRDCEEAPAPTVDDPVEPTEALDEDGRWFGGAVPAGAAAVELQFAGTTVQATAVDAPAYRGAFAGRVRFFLAAVPREAGELLEVRVRDGAGRLIGFEGFSRRASGPRTRLGTGRLGPGTRWTARAFHQDVEAPAAGDPERREHRLCLAVSLRSRGTESTVTDCREAGREAAGLLVPLSDCESHRMALAMLLPPGSRARATLILGDGRTLRLRERALEAGERAAFGPVPSGQAVRAVRVGSRTRRLELPPDRLQCGFDVGEPRQTLSAAGVPGPFSADPDDLFAPPPAPVPGAAPLARIAIGGQPVELLGAIAGDRLCVGLGAAPVAPDGCAPPPLRARQPRVAGFRPPGADAAALAVVTAPSVAAVALVNVRFDEAGPPVATVPAGTGRAALLQLPVDQVPRAIRLLDAGGHALADVALGPVATGTTRTFARGPGWVASITPTEVPEAIVGRLLPLSGDCIQVGPRAPDALDSDCIEMATGRVDVLATCKSRLLHVFGGLGGRAHRAVLVLADSRRVTAKARRGAFHAALRRRHELRRVELVSRRGRVTGVVRLRAPAPAAQCGYRAAGIQAG
jgi:hypothetical protein